MTTDSLDDRNGVTLPEDHLEGLDGDVVDREVVEKAKSLVAAAPNVASGRSPRAVAAGAVYAAGLLLQKEITQRDAGDLFGVSDATTQERYTDILKRATSEHQFDEATIEESTAEELLADLNGDYLPDASKTELIASIAELRGWTAGEEYNDPTSYQPDKLRLYVSGFEDLTGTENRIEQLAILQNEFGLTEDDVRIDISLTKSGAGKIESQLATDTANEPN